MSTFEFEPQVPASIAISDSQNRFPVRRIFCVGRNYAAHAREMGKDPDREPPFFFTKPADAVADSGSAIPYPPETSDFHYEIELVIAIGKDCVSVSKEEALDTVWGYGVGIDLTRRDLQLSARDKGRPWDWGKAFDLSAPCAPLKRVSEVGHVDKGRIWLAVNGTIRQDADVAELIWDVPEIISILSQSMSLKRGDLIMTGTPAGVGAIVAGDKVTGGIDGLGEIEINILEAASPANRRENAA
ncbi:fumarylacetoacetate hydrolase family protein (plasmid) [Rhizobium sp. NIBRBAC000502774]|uniref:fumarylacetoacetate hydrolase family protein n=1 Tax=Agrobacterium TaxID=357 RepID=UPI00080FA008|nr:MULTISPECIES: fumarylacetoacetate hydrolase family protein [Agrobacterium]QDG93817.1 fumarylacetoacetate hydrolase family protein [Rhizobium sp. NIBRBAC000502774]NSY46480.1 fumarylacetoacetate hydrolase family protein [Agrobacterium tumefaciens]NSZ76937.1 fumarylacetoacetate hydrolase family protein [Agrobacterium tumefaciens]NSZ87417.1 fumarylacetoacetate hydrolase family protein [Agrobacterium tumefaciens]UZX45276.1 fumarylacetoacetate hydrolase family protein [Agrobacterium sp. 13-2099-1